MKRRPDHLSKPSSAALVVGLALAAVLVSLRAESLLMRGFEPTTHTERRWYAWATDPAQGRAALIDRLAREPNAAGDPPMLRVPVPEGMRSELADVVARYFAPRSRVELYDASEQVGSAGSEAPRSMEDSWQAMNVADWLALGLGCAATLALGISLLPARRPRDLPAAWACGWCIWLCVGGFAASLGLPVGSGFAWSSWIVALAVFAWRRPRIELQPGIRRSEDVGAIELGLRGLCCAAWGMAVWKVVLAPLWSWDHWAIWGFKSRLLLESRALEVLAERSVAAPQYPLGLPAAWNVVIGGALLGPEQVKVLHLIGLTSVGLLAGQLARRVGASSHGAAATTAFTWLLPLAWSTEGLGLAEVSLAQTLLFVCWLIAGKVEKSSRSMNPLAPLGLVALALTKDEGLPLALLLLLFWLVTVPGGRAPRAALTVALLATARGLTPSGGTPFTSGDWQSRLGGRLDDPFSVLSPVFVELARLEVFGLWLLVPLALGVAALRWRRNRGPLLLLGLACAQMAAYVGIYFVTYLDPEAHVVSSLARIASALEPVVAAGLLAVICPPPRVGESAVLLESESSEGH
ncbi:MAG: hypothetical protein AAGK22_09550 [Acidobacteriota bacterium]